MSSVAENIETKPQEFWLVPNTRAERRKITLTPEFEEEIYSSGRYEIAYGEIKERSMPSPIHGRIQLKLGSKILSYVEQNNLGAVYTETHFEFAEKLSRVPDIAFVSFGRFPEGGEDESSRWHIAPDLAVEIISPTDDYEDVQEKITEYFTFGVTQVWIISPESKTLHIYFSRTSVKILTETDQLVGEEILEGFKMNMNEIFQSPKS